MVLNQFTCWRKRTHTANFEYSVVKKLVIAQPTSKYFRWPSKRSQHGQPRSFVQASVCAGLGAFVSVDVSEAGDGFLDGMRAHLVCCTWLYGSSRKCVFFCVFVLFFFVLCLFCFLQTEGKTFRLGLDLLQYLLYCGGPEAHCRVSEVCLHRMM